MGVEGIDPRKVVGTYVKPKDWNKLISDPEVLLIDTVTIMKSILVPSNMPLTQKRRPLESFLTT